MYQKAFCAKTTFLVPTPKKNSGLCKRCLEGEEKKTKMDYTLAEADWWDKPKWREGFLRERVVKLSG